MTAVAYLAGVLHGDAYCSNKVICLTVKDKDFANTFAVALELATGSITRPRPERKYWRVANRNDNGRFSWIKTYEPQTDDERAAWLRGLFDSEGNATFTKLSRVSENSYNRRVAFYSTNKALLERAQGYLVQLEILTNIRCQKLSATHKGTRPVYELFLTHSSNNFLRFAWLVGSSIARKREALFAIPLSYTADIPALMRRAQKLGAAAKHRKTMEVTLPAVIKEVNKLIHQGIKPTQRTCRSIPGFNSIQRWITQGKLISMAVKR